MQFTLTELWAHMGLFARGVVGFMAIMSVGSMWVMLERAWAFRKERKSSTNYLQTVAGPLSSSDFSTAMSQSGDAYMARVIRAGLKAYLATSTDRDLALESTARAVERQAARELQLLKRGLGVLATVGSTAPFVGLLGTVMGIVNAFQQMAATGSGGLGTVSAGIAEALITTAFGLLVAIPAVMAYNFMQGWVDARGVDMAEASNELLDAVSRQPRR